MTGADGRAWKRYAPEDETLMWIIARRPGDPIVLGVCRVTVVTIDPDDVRLGVRAPADLVVTWGECLHRGSGSRP